MLHLGALILPDLHNQDAAGAKQPRGLGNQCAVGVKSIAAAVQRAKRVVIADLGCEMADFRGANIGRVRHDQIERARQRGRIVAGGESRATGQFQMAGIGACGMQRRRADVGADPLRIR